MVDALDDDDEQVRLAVAESLCALSIENRTLVVQPLLTIAAESRDADRRARAGIAVVETGECTWKDLPEDSLEAIALNPRCDTKVRDKAFEALGGWQWRRLGNAADFPDRGDPAVVAETVSSLIVTQAGASLPSFEQWALWIRARARAQLGESDEAIDDARRSHISAFDARGMLDFARRLLDAGRRAAASEFVTDALSIWLDYPPESVDATRSETEAQLRLLLGWLSYLDGDGQTAISQSAAAARLSSGVVGVAAAFNLGLAHLVLGDATAAAAAYAEALTRCGDLSSDDAAVLMEHVSKDLDDATSRAPSDAWQKIHALVTSFGPDSGLT